MAERKYDMMRVAAGLYHGRLGFHFLHYIPIEDAENWLLATDCDLLGNDVFDFDGELVPVGELNPTIIHLHSLDKAFNRECGFKGRCADFVVKVPR